MRRIARLRLVIALFAASLALAAAGQSSVKLNTASEGVRPADVESALAVLCAPKKITHGKNGTADGCKDCPTDTTFAGDGVSKLQIYAQTLGHFTSPAVDNLILSSYGCEPHSDNYGGSYLFSLTGGKAHLVRYNLGLLTDECHKFAFEDGHNFLVCESGWGGMGESDTYAEMVTFDGAGKANSTRLVSLHDSTGTCDTDPSQTVQAAEIREIRFTPPNSGRITELTVLAKFGEVHCSQVAKQVATKGGTPPMLGKMYELEYGFDGKRFTPTAATRVALKRIEVE